jgi:hypothetical protein
LLKKFIAELTGVKQGAVDASPESGKLYSFETAPYTEFSSSQTGRYAAFKLLGVSKDYYVLAVLDGTWDRPPTLQQAARCAILEEHRFAHTGRPAVFGVNTDWWDPNALKCLTPLGMSGISKFEKELASNVLALGVGSRFSTMNAANYAAEGEWRWTHDHDALAVEVELDSAKKAEKRAAAERRYQERLSKLSFEQLLTETPLPRWAGVSPYPPAEFTAAARAKLHEATRALMALGPKPRKVWVRKVLKETVEWFNEADRAADGVIETEEREDICGALEELAFAAKQRALFGEIDNWREW